MAATEHPPGICSPSFEPKKALRDAREVIQSEISALSGLLSHLDGGFTQTVQTILACQGRVVVTGMGKSGIVGQKISATLASTGTPSLFLHAAEAVHGDIGRIKRDDVVLALSNSGESEEVVRLIRPVKEIGSRLIALVGNPQSSLARHADVVICIGHAPEACPMGLVPTASTTTMMALGDALAIALFNCRGFGREEYARFHPGGQLGRKLMRVREVMRKGHENPVADEHEAIRSVVVVMTKTAGRPGAASIVDKDGKLVGFFTDGDLRRLLYDVDFSPELPIHKVMHRDPKVIHPEQLVAEATRVLRDNQIDQVPVVDDDGKPVGLLDVQDLLTTRLL